LASVDRQTHSVSVPLDQAGAVRPDEELPVARLEAYLKKNLTGTTGELQVFQFPNGASNLTYLLQWGGREMVLRRPPFGNPVKTAHDMGREFRVLSKLHKVYKPAPEPFLFCDDKSILGDSFYVLERRKGVIIRGTLPSGLDIDPETARGMSEGFIDNLAELHSVDFKAAGLEDLGRPAGYVERQVTGWTQRYRNAQTHEFLEIDKAIEWVNRNIPKETGAVIVHNDYKYDNMILDPNDLTRIIAVLDWEMSTVGDPLVDLGVSLGYWREAPEIEKYAGAWSGLTSLGQEARE